MGALTYAVRFRPVLKYLGQLGFVLAVMTLVPLSMSLLLGDFDKGFRYGIVVAGIFALSLCLIRIPVNNQRLQTNEAMVITALTFGLVSLAMTWPMMSSGLTFLDALFETISGLTTTGLSVTAAVGDKPETFLFSRAWMQWVGGLGIMVLSLAIMIQPGAVAKRLGQSEDFAEDLILNTRSHARLIFIVYALLTAVGIVWLGLLGIGWFEAVLYAFAAVSTGGFSPHDLSLAAFAGPIPQFVVILLSVSGGISLILYHRLFKEGWRVVLKDPQFQAFLAICVSTAILLSGTLWWQNGFTGPRALQHGIVNALSAQSTAGFSSINIGQLSAGSKLILIVSMLSGGMVGSTAGGIKILRLLILFRLLSVWISKAGAPSNAVMTPQLGGRRLESDEIHNAAVLFIVFLSTIILSWAIFIFMGHNPMDSLFEVVSAIGTVGLSSGISGPDLHPFLKLVLCGDMLMGRLEILAWLILLSPGTWFGKRKEN